MTEVRPLQLEKALLPIEVTELPMVTVVRPVQSEKAEFPIVVTELPMVTESRPVQPEKAEFPMVVTESGMFTDRIPLHQANRWEGIVVTLFPMFTVDILRQPSKGKSLKWTKSPAYVQFVALKFTVVRLMQLEKAEFPIEVTELPMVAEAKPMQLEKA